MADPFALRIYVPDGDPEGVRIIDRMNWTGRGFVVPRDQWAKLKTRPDLAHHGIYILTGSDVDELGNDITIAYIGQTDNVQSRINDHDLKKDFWDRAVIFLSGNNGLNRAHTTWLEWELIQRAGQAKRCRLSNKIEPGEPTLIESEKADTRAFLNEMLRIVPVMGLHIFERQKAPPPPAVLKEVGLLPEPKDIRDTIVVPAQKDNFEKAFLGKNAWWSIRIAEYYRSNLRWIAAYQVLPTAAITHVAEIDHIEPSGDLGKWKVVFKTAAAARENPIPFGNAPSAAIMGPRYTTYAALLAAKTLPDLLPWAHSS